MNNEQNEKLCKLLGIDAYFCTEGEQPYTTDDKICELCDSNYKECWSRQKHYPDLSAPSNFVKLQQIYFDCMRVIALNYSDYGSDIVSGFITKFYNFVLYAGDVVPKEVEQFKQQAQQTDWEY